MQWYYVNGENEKVGPVTESELQVLVDDGAITPDTLVFHDGMEDWQPYAAASADLVVPQPPPIPESIIMPLGAAQCCAECSAYFDPSEMVQYKNLYVCAACKPLFFQRLREGGTVGGQFQYAGFWIRFAAKFLDGIVVNIILLPATLCVQFYLGDTLFPTLLNWLLQLALPLTYSTYFLGKYGATLGKMICGIRVVRPDGQRISYWRAFGRHFAELLSSLILGIGYIMAAFDSEKQALHDRICDTRVVYKRK